MQANSKLSRVMIIVRFFLTGSIFFLGGGTLIGLGIYMLVNSLINDPYNVNYTVNIILMILGLILLFIGVASFVVSMKSVKKKKPLSEEEIKENEALLKKDNPIIDNVKNVKLFLHFGGKYNQSYFVETKERKVVYECRIQEYNPVLTNTYEFVDTTNNFSKIVKVGKTINIEDSSGTMVNLFKIDGVMCWDYLYKLGYEIKQEFLNEGKIIKKLDLYKTNDLVASIYLVDVKYPWNENNQNDIKNPQASFRIEIIDAKLEDAVMGAFILARVNMVD